jgi:hypothetical protein
MSLTMEIDCDPTRCIMSDPLTAFQDYVVAIKAEAEALRAELRARDEAATPVAPVAEVSAIGDVSVMHFRGPIEPFTLTINQLEVLSACWTQIQEFLGGDAEGTISGEEPEGQGSPVRDRPNYGISRIDQPEKANHGWYVRIMSKGRKEQKFFSDKLHGGRESALEVARKHRDGLKADIFAGKAVVPAQPSVAAGVDDAYI